MIKAIFAIFLSLMLLSGCESSLDYCKKCRLVFGDVTKKTETGEIAIANAEVLIIVYNRGLPGLKKIIPSKKYRAATTKTDEKGHFFVVFDNFDELLNANIRVHITKGAHSSIKDLSIKNINDDLYFHVILPTQ